MLATGGMQLVSKERELLATGGNRSVRSGNCWPLGATGQQGAGTAGYRWQNVSKEWELLAWPQGATG